MPSSYLNPDESLTEAVSGLIVVLSITLAASVLSGSGQDGVRSALLGAVGASAASGLIDAVLYMMGSAFDRNRRVRLGRAIASTADETAALAAIQSELDPYLASVTRFEDREQLYRSVHSSLVHGWVPPRTALVRDDFMGATAIFCISLAASVPAVLPLLLINHPWIAIRVSNLLVVVMLFIVGYHWAKYVEANRWLAGFGLVAIGLVLVVSATLLGG